MRYYVLYHSDFPSIPPFIIAEVIRDPLETDEDREISLAAGIAGSRSAILTRGELLADPATREALERWDARDDSEYDRETSLLLSDDGSPAERTGNVTYMNGVAPEPPKHYRIVLPVDSRHREVILQSRGLRTLARALVQQSQQRRAESLRRRRPGPRAIDPLGEANA